MRHYFFSMTTIYRKLSATFFNYTYQYSIRRVKELLRTDPNCFEKKVRDADYKMTYASDHPSEQ